MCEPSNRELLEALDVAKKSAFLASLIVHSLTFLSYLGTKKSVQNIFCNFDFEPDVGAFPSIEANRRLTIQDLVL